MPIFRGHPVRTTRTAAGSRRHTAHQVVVKLKASETQRPDVQRDVLRALPRSSTVESGFDRFGIALVNLPPGTDTSKVVDRLRRHVAVEYAEPHLLDSGS